MPSWGTTVRSAVTPCCLRQPCPRTPSSRCCTRPLPGYVISFSVVHRHTLTPSHRRLSQDRSKWDAGKVSGAVYHGGDALTEVIGTTFSLFALSNPLHPDLFPSVRNMESEVVAWSTALFHGGPDACGTMTSGGTESILLACRAYRDLAKAKRGVTRPNMVVPTSAHAAFHKAGDYFGIEVRMVPVDETSFRADVQGMAAQVDSNTVMLVASAISFPQGVVDPVQELAALAAKHGGIPLHVDCCLGSYLIPFANAVRGPDAQLPPFDFAVPGVTSISADTHKFGYAPKGSSVIMYSKAEFRYHQFYVSPRWTGGVYTTPSIAGSRAGALVAATWATMRFHGQEGYRAAAKRILTAAQAVAQGVRDMQAEGLGIKLYGEPDLCVVAFGPDPSAAKPVSVPFLFEAMTAKGWNLNNLQRPANIHLCVTYKNAEVAAASFADDLRASIAEIEATPDKFKGGMGAVYGVAESIPVDGPIDHLSRTFVAALYTTPQGGPEAPFWYETGPEAEEGAATA